ncbi:hypothetical protein HMPREF1092_03260 [Clostridium thermobutyricum]|uniref:LexA repressor DNA-binding domain-containing protein n=1 Tax=Clostridium thermobutyricum TaxID=29372 RepID=N9W6Z1_9CLOT|nr:hypothetical protein [Clostridium thermobutyricum]ENY98780.1 hypothetical protein HMPREF1092_03260 [Clostridium thermobutyricum]
MEKRKLGKTADSILNYINDYTLEYGYSPTVREIGQAIGLHSTSTVYQHIQRLIRDGYLYKNPTCPRTLVVNKNPNDLLQDFLYRNNFRYKVENSKIIVDLK